MPKKNPNTNPTGFGRYTPEEFYKRVRAGLNWHEEVRLADLKRAKEREQQDASNSETQPTV